MLAKAGYYGGDVEKIGDLPLLLFLQLVQKENFDKQLKALHHHLDIKLNHSK